MLVFKLLFTIFKACCSIALTKKESFFLNPDTRFAEKRFGRMLREIVNNGTTLHVYFKERGFVKYSTGGNATTVFPPRTDTSDKYRVVLPLWQALSALQGRVG